MNRLLKEDRIDLCCLAWDFYLLLLAHSMVPWSIMDASKIKEPLVLRLGNQGEQLLAGDQARDCAGLPVLADEEGPKAAPWLLADPDQFEDCTEPLYACYMPDETARKINPKAHLGRIIWMTWAYHFVVEKTFKSAG